MTLHSRSQLEKRGKKLATVTCHKKLVSWSQEPGMRHPFNSERKSVQPKLSVQLRSKFHPAVSSPFCIHIPGPPGVSHGFSSHRSRTWMLQRTSNYTCTS